MSVPEKLNGKHLTRRQLLERLGIVGPASFAGQWTESRGFGPSIPTKQRMPNQRGGSEPVGRFFKLAEDEKAIPDEARTPIDTSGPPNETAKSRGNRLMETHPGQA